MPRFFPSGARVAPPGIICCQWSSRSTGTPTLLYERAPRRVFCFSEGRLKARSTSC